MVTTGETGVRDGFLAHSRRIHEINTLEEEKEQMMQYANTLDGICTAMAAQRGEEICVTTQFTRVTKFMPLLAESATIIM